MQKYLESKFGDALEDVSNAMLELARSLPPSQLAEKAYALYEKFRPEIPPGKKGWGASGKLGLDFIRFPCLTRHPEKEEIFLDSLPFIYYTYR